MTSVGVSWFGLPAAGVILSSTGGSATLINGGSIGALVRPRCCRRCADSTITNNGTITGFVELSGGDNNIINNGDFDLRHFADTDGGGVRDTLRVAIAIHGAREFKLYQQWQLAQPLGCARRDDPRQHAGQYLPFGNAN